MARLVTDRVDFLLDKTTWDLTFVNRDIAFSTGSNAVGQAIKFKLQLLKEEWFLDKNAGTPWLQEILGQRFNPNLVRSLFFNLVSSVEGVQEIQRLDVEFTSTTRNLQVAYTVLTVFGDTINDTVNL